MDYYTGKKILVIGGTGTIGNGLIKELLKQEPSVIRILSRDEYKQFIMENEIEDKSKLRYLIGDVRDYDRVDRAMDEIDVVFNLAAMKHVPACEYNPSEAIKTNVIGMENVIKAAINNNVESVVFTSSDKAINPTNSYGATKLLAEKLVQAANYSKGRAKTKFTAVRFGNVMGSRGSVIPLFKKQIEDFRKITITDPNMTRFMMTLSQSIKLIMTAGEISLGGEVFILKMPIIKLQHLADVVVEEIAKKTNISLENIDIQIIGIRAGERNFEELMTKQESEFAYDLGDMYAVLSSDSVRGLEVSYKKYKKAEVGSYNSSEGVHITKEQVRKLILSDKLI
ncbi:MULTISPECIES: SDR family NAD(P)-dependent oxidoreductase [unclassified Clostridium]|uniref:SDR family NAD(P)-dependent oxidoreductase n=1 Tax=unclassified Clostridium TaxID=2614128 RepID=UPI0013F7CA96|nr:MULTISPECIES: SDR family NAD(P)-dependent oxidoreductase [unclassified Clostridium]NFT06913.1 SDR family NAD(P)-dependent oxidoreductase [Clostridium botulinum]